MLPGRVFIGTLHAWHLVFLGPTVAGGIISERDIG
jgi:hypothetical protein